MGTHTKPSQRQSQTRLLFTTTHTQNTKILTNPFSIYYTQLYGCTRTQNKILQNLNHKPGFYLLPHTVIRIYTHPQNKITNQVSIYYHTHLYGCIRRYDKNTQAQSETIPIYYHTPKIKTLTNSITNQVSIYYNTRKAKTLTSSITN